MSMAARAGAHSGNARIGAVEHGRPLGQRGEVRRLDDRMAVRRQPRGGQLIGHQHEKAGGCSCSHRAVEDRHKRRHRRAPRRRLPSPAPGAPSAVRVGPARAALLSPAMPQPPPAAAGPLVVAHRGAWAAAPQNSLDAFQAAITLGCSAIETDVRRTADGQLVVVHDARVGGRHGRAPGPRAAPGADAGGAGARAAMRPGAGRRTGRPRRGAQGGRLRGGGDGGSIARRLTPDQYVITSFRDAVLPQVKRCVPEARTGLLVGPRLRLRELDRRVRQTGVDFLAPHAALARRGILRWAADRELTAWLWTVNDPRLLRQACCATCGSPPSSPTGPSGRWRCSQSLTRATAESRLSTTWPRTPSWGLGTVERRSTTDQVLHELRAAILAGRIKPQEALPEAALAQAFGTGRSAIREALRHLVQEGLVVSEINRGARVRPISTEDVIDVYRVRTAIEMAAVTALLERPGAIDPAPLQQRPAADPGRLPGRLRGDALPGVDRRRHRLPPRAGGDGREPAAEPGPRAAGRRIADAAQLASGLRRVGLRRRPPEAAGGDLRHGTPAPPTSCAPTCT